VSQRMPALSNIPAEDYMFTMLNNNCSS
jgi:hypothetical protein